MTRAAFADAAVDAASTAARVRGIVDAHYDSVWRSLRRLGVPESSVDDAAQEVFCVLARKIDAVPPEKVRTFLFGVVLRTAQGTRRATARRREDHDDGAIASRSSVAPTADELLDERRARVMLDRILDEMPMDLRTVFVLYEIEELTMADIATMLDVPAGTVASRLRRARETFESGARRVRDGGAR